MRHRISLTLAFLFALACGSNGCDVLPFHCEGTDFADPNGGPLCYCNSNNLLCGHSGFDGCLSCAVE